MLKVWFEESYNEDDKKVSNERNSCKYEQIGRKERETKIKKWKENRKIKDKKCTDDEGAQPGGLEKEQFVQKENMSAKDRRKQEKLKKIAMLKAKLGKTKSENAKAMGKNIEKKLNPERSKNFLQEKNWKRKNQNALREKKAKKIKISWRR